MINVLHIPNFIKDAKKVDTKTSDSNEEKEDFISMKIKESYDKYNHLLLTRLLSTQKYTLDDPSLLSYGDLKVQMTTRTYLEILREKLPKQAKEFDKKVISIAHEIIDTAFYSYLSKSTKGEYNCKDTDMLELLHFASANIYGIICEIVATESPKYIIACMEERGVANGKKWKY